MSNDLKRIFDGIIGTLNESVLPNLSNEFARGQVFASIYLLSEMKTRTDWAEEWLRDHLAIHLRAFEQVGAATAGLDTPEAPFAAVPDDLSVSRLAIMRDEADSWMCAVQRWIDTAAPGPAVTAAEKSVGEAIKAQAALEVALTPRPAFTKVAKG